MQRHVAPTNRNKSLVSALFGLVGYETAPFLFVRHRAKFRMSGFRLVRSAGTKLLIFSHKTQ